MLRVAKSKTRVRLWANKQLTPHNVEYILANATPLALTDGRTLNTSPLPFEEQPKRGGSWRWIAGGVAILGVGMGTLYASDDARHWFIEKIPASKSQFARLGLSVERPITLVIEEPSGPQTVDSSTSEIKCSTTSIKGVADKTVSGLSVNNALANDLSKKEAWTKEAIEKHFCKSKCAVEKQPAEVSTSSEHQENIRQLREKTCGDHEGASFLQAGADSAKLLMTNLGSPTAAQLEEKTRKENERHQQKMAEKERKDAEYLQKKKENLERKATLELEKQKKMEAEEKEAAEAALIKIGKNHEFEGLASRRISEVCEVADHAIKTSTTAIATCKEHANRLKEAMDVSLEEEAVKLWPVVQDLNDVRLQQIEEAHRVQKLAEEAIIDYLSIIDGAKADLDTKDNQNIPVYRKQIQEIAYQVQSVYEKLKSQESVATIMKHYYQIMKRDKADFLKELEAIVPQIKLDENGLNLSEEELNSLLAHAHRRIFQLRRQLKEQQLLEHQRLEDALCEQRKADYEEANIKIGEELDKQYIEMQMVKEAELLAQSKRFEAEIEERVAKESGSYHDRLQDMLALQQKQLMGVFELSLKERLIHERHIFMDNIAKNIAKVKGLESALEERANLEKVITHVQDLTCSSLCLMHAIAHDVDCVGEEYDIIRIDDPLKRCFLAAEQNPFAQAILHTIPNLAAERGIYTISSLEKRFDRVYAECRKALDGWLTYFFTDPKPRYLNAAEFESAEGMSQTDLVVQAKYFMDKKCMAEAVRCLIQLDGTARSLAQDWIEEARLVLEVRQAAEVLLAFASSKGMGTIF